MKSTQSARTFKRRLVRWTGLVAAILAVHIADAQSPRTSSPLTVEIIQKQNAQISTQLRSAVITETIKEKWKFAETIEQHRMLQTQAVLDGRDSLVRQAQAANATPERLNEILSNADVQLEELQFHLQVAELNGDFVLRRTTTLDVSGRRLRRDDRDLRNLDQLVRVHGLNASQRKSLDKTSSLIAIRDEPEVRLHPPAIGALATIHDNRTLSIEKELLKFGVIPSSLMGLASTLEVSQDPRAGEVQIVGRDGNGKIALEISLSPSNRHAMTRYAIVKSGVIVEEFLASDFRAINGVSIPFATRQTFSQQSPEYCVVERRVESARINEPIEKANEVFSIPKDYRIQDLTAAQRSTP